MKSYSYSALTLSAIAVSACSVVVSGYLYYENIGNRWAYLAAMLVLGVGWIAQHFSDDHRAVQTSILLAGLLLLVATVEKLAHYAGWATGAALDQRLFGVLLGAVVVTLSNAIPKNAASARTLATRRTIGWALVLGGLGFALAWLVLPLAVASNVAIAALLLGLAIGIAAYARSRFVGLLVFALSFITAVQAQTRDLTDPRHGFVHLSASRATATLRSRNDHRAESPRTSSL